jgi:hypothetical protein
VVEEKALYLSQEQVKDSYYNDTIKVNYFCLRDRRKGGGERRGEGEREGRGAWIQEGRPPLSLQ